MENVIDNIVEEVLTGSEPGSDPVIEGKTFTQNELDRIVKDRLAKEKVKTQQQFEAMEKEFKQKELNLQAKELLSSKGLSLDILEALK